MHSGTFEQDGSPSPVDSSPDFEVMTSDGNEAQELGLRVFVAVEAEVRRNTEEVMLAQRVRDRGMQILIVQSEEARAYRNPNELLEKAITEIMGGGSVDPQERAEVKQFVHRRIKEALGVIEDRFNRYIEAAADDARQAS